MNDRELLELAAKAAGYKYDHKISVWNPLTDDGDCARLEEKLKICIEWWSDSICCTCGDGSSWTEIFADHKDKNAARRYASTALAAEIGKGMK